MGLRYVEIAREGLYKSPLVGEVGVEEGDIKLTFGDGRSRQDFLLSEYEAKSLADALNVNLMIIRQNRGEDVSNKYIVSLQEISKNYVCKKCGAFQCKLWRQYNTFADHIKMLCAECAMVMSKEDKGKEIDEAGYLESKYGKTDHIGGMVPAIPCNPRDLEESYWGYSSVPENAVQWWRNLPTYPTKY